MEEKAQINFDFILILYEIYEQIIVDLELITCLFSFNTKDHKRKHQKNKEVFFKICEEIKTRFTLNYKAVSHT